MARYMNGVFNKRTDKVIYEDYNNFYNSLVSNYKSTLNALVNYDFDDCNFEEMYEKLSEAIYNTLSIHDFYITRKDINLLNYNPLFLLSSLDNNYGATIDLIARANSDGKVEIQIPSFTRENKMIEEKLMEYDFVLTAKTASLINNSPAFLFASLRRDVNKTFKALNKFNGVGVDLDYTQFQELVAILFEEEGLKFSHLPQCVKNMLVRYIGKNYTDNIPLIEQLVEKGHIPISYIPGHVLEITSSLAESCNDDLEKYAYLNSNIRGTFSIVMGEAQEKKLLSMLGKKYSKCKCVEDALILMKKKRLKREDMTIPEMFVFQMYAIKKLNEAGLNRIVNVFSFDHNMENLGNYYGEFVNLHINAKADSVVEMIKVLNHEIAHAVQEYNVATGNLSKDIDVDIYSKDKILRELLGNEYYHKNYTSISYEFDAEYKANIETAKLFDLVDIVYNHDTDYFVMQKNAMAVTSYAEDKVYEEKMRRHIYRDKSFICTDTLNQIFEDEMGKIREKDMGRYQDILRRYPIIKYEYNTEGCFERKTIEEMIDTIDSSKDKRTIGIYYNLLRNRFDPEKEKYSDLDDAIDEISNLYNNRNNYNGVTRQILEKLHEISENYSNNKYIGYFYKIGGNKR